MIRLIRGRKERNERGQVIYTVTEVGTKRFNDAYKCIGGRQT